MFRIHLPRRNWIKDQICYHETIKEVLNSVETWMGEIIDGEHLIIEYTDTKHGSGFNRAIVCGICGVVHGLKWDGECRRPGE